ncbi:14934_t:CDS:10 [Cetraspora pellucida]|uniref:14934_t:CDS:1 n=1 Tax=Cetraspora pellucida TaxID=1433469 RepID=A0A9N9H8B3_9GLOM|nr:14934_t:CDS:10 [Cetraspora pellucida]
MSEINEILATTAQIRDNSALNESHSNESGVDPGTEFEEPYVGRNSQHGTMALILLAGYVGWLMVDTNVYFWNPSSFLAIYDDLVLYLASRKPLNHKTPRLVYKWFSFVYKVSYAVGITGYSIIMFTFFGIIQLFYTGTEVIELGVLLLCYGLYFGVLNRDFVEICTDRMASTLGYYNKDGFPRKHLRANICAICGVAANGTDEVGEQQNVFQLACRHVFHDDCIRGWCLIGKKDICPYCKEKVDMKEFKTNPWDTQQQLYLSLLDGVRYLIVWQPVIFAFVELAYHLFGLE